MSTKISWEKFSQFGLLWLVNRFLIVFGVQIVLDRASSMVCVYPVIVEDGVYPSIDSAEEYEKFCKVQALVRARADNLTSRPSIPMEEDFVKMSEIVSRFDDLCAKAVRVMKSKSTRGDAIFHEADRIAMEHEKILSDWLLSYAKEEKTGEAQT